MTFKTQFKNLVLVALFSSASVWAALLTGPVTLQNFQEPAGTPDLTSPVTQGSFKVWFEANGKVTVTNLQGKILWTWTPAVVGMELDDIVFPDAMTVGVLVGGSESSSGAYFFEIATGRLLRMFPYAWHEIGAVNSDTLYLTNKNVLTAYNRHTFDKLWSTRLPERKARPYNLRFIDTNIVTGYAWYLYLLNAETGDIEDEAKTRCFINGGGIYLTAPDKFVVKQGCASGDTGPSWTEYLEFGIR